MDPLGLPTCLFVFIPEQIMITALGLMLFGIRLKARYLVFLGVLQGVISYMLGRLPLFFGLNVIVKVFLVALVVALILQLPYRVTLTAMMVSGTISVIMEAVLVPLVLIMTELPLTEILNSAKLQFLCFVPKGLLMFILVLLIHRHNIRLLDLHDLGIVGNGRWWQS